MLFHSRPTINDFLARIDLSDPGSVEPALRWHGNRHHYNVDFAFGEDRAGYFRVGLTTQRALGLAHADGILLRIKNTPAKLVARLHDNLGHELVHLAQARRTSDREFFQRAWAVHNGEKVVPAFPLNEPRTVYLGRWWEREAYSWSVASQIWFAGHCEWPGFESARRASEALRDYCATFGADDPVTREVVARAVSMFKLVKPG